MRLLRKNARAFLVGILVLVPLLVVGLLMVPQVGKKAGLELKAYADNIPSTISCDFKTDKYGRVTSCFCPPGYCGDCSVRPEGRGCNGYCRAHP